MAIKKTMGKLYENKQSIKCFSTISEFDEVSHDSYLTSMPTKSLFNDSNDDKDNLLSVSSLDENSDKLYLNKPNISNYAAGDNFPGPRQKVLPNENELRKKFEMAYKKLNSEMSESTWKMNPELNILEYTESKEKINDIFDAIEGQTSSFTENRTGVMFTHKSKKPKNYKLRAIKPQEPVKAKSNDRKITNIQKDTTCDKLSLLLGDNISHEFTNTSIDKLKEAPGNIRPQDSSKRSEEQQLTSQKTRFTLNIPHIQHPERKKLHNPRRANTNYSLLKDTNFKNKSDSNLYTIVKKTKEVKEEEMESKYVSVVNVFPSMTNNPEEGIFDSSVDSSACHEDNKVNSVYVYNQNQEESVSISVDVFHDQNFQLSPQLASGDNPQSKLHSTPTQIPPLPIFSTESGDDVKSSHSAVKVLSPISEDGIKKIRSPFINDESEFDRKSGERLLGFRENLIMLDPESNTYAPEYIVYEDKEFDEKIAVTRKVTKVSKLYKKDMNKSTLYTFYLPLSHYYGVEEGFR